MYVTEACNVYLSHLKLMPVFTISFGLLRINFAKKIQWNIFWLFLQVSESQLFFSNLTCSNVLDLRNLQEQVKKAFRFKNCNDCHCLNKLFYWSKRFCKFSALSLEFRKIFMITTSIFSHSRSEQFWKQNTITL